MVAREPAVLARGCLFVFGVVLTVSFANARAATYVVDQSAHGAADTNPGTEEKPFKTVQKAADTVKPGDTVYVMAGKYDERVAVKTSGTEGKSITFEAMPRRGAVVGGFDLGASYVRIVGFEITWPKPETAIQFAGQHCEVLDNYIHDMFYAVEGTVGVLNADKTRRDFSAVSHNRVACNKVYHCEFGFILGGNDWLVEQNEVSRLFMYADPNQRFVDCDYSRFFGKGCIERFNYYHGTDTQESKVAHVDGLQTFAVNGEIAENVLFENNVVCDWGQGCMIDSDPHLGNVRQITFRRNIFTSKRPNYEGSWGVNFIDIPDVTVENNTFAGIVWYGVGLRGKNCTNGRIVGNICYDVSSAICDRDRNHPESASPFIEYNLAFKTEQPLGGDKNINQDPLFVEAGKRDFRLQKDSPAIATGADKTTIGALEYPNVYYVDVQHGGASDEGFGYPGAPFKTIAAAIQMAQPGETIVIRGGTYRETIAQAKGGVTIRAMKGEKVVISGADLIEGWARGADAGWSAPLSAEPKSILRDGKPWSEFSYDKAAKKIAVKAGGDPRLHIFEAVVREQGIDLAGKKDVKVEDITVENTLKDLR
jgi:hypothetical protein